MNVVVRLIHGVIWSLAAYKWGDWKNWRVYYPSMLFFAFGDIIYCLTFYDNWLWVFRCSYIRFPFNDLFNIFTVFSFSVLIYLTHYPKKLYDQVIYIVLWVFIYTGIEAILYSLGLVGYDNGWNIWWSMLHNTYQFPVLKLHHDKPLLAWFVCIIISVIMTTKFKIPFKIIM
ncbi:hypothetical protein CPJCM30710_02970 [Clostridium polyendosporum]|uniref:Uncharacterized protein n=1 Tax=Clostridium polyendosporum TaxID=69208 RepID=A0A919VFM0_9CLOT|nr:CBO0543 family protein [Clostridium polyendosporum]GIM27631.1 hypothetical protein CPJCM30710_02970 [Clostridium polyendosporum]